MGTLSRGGHLLPLTRFLVRVHARIEHVWPQPLRCVVALAALRRRSRYYTAKPLVPNNRKMLMGMGERSVKYAQKDKNKNKLVRLCGPQQEIKITS